ncbi:class I SAM-dependent methyltransferase [Brevibacillus dissolubilis]|uniref:class I SAM-dependent methyltransferase n=1 Tax=Brevibacillus dissolubilis TaxID=1844116 RepID=UPI001115BB79|nr:methyltransferase domain-containing protein [Brevibacillus dissolubilis]
MSDILVFLRRFVTHPDRVGSIMPSSRFLSNLMLKQVPWHTVKTVVELGPGTGVFTKAILQKKKPNTNFFVVERDPQFQEMLSKRFPDLIIRDEAVLLTSYLEEMNFPKADAIVSGLPFAVFPPELRKAILDNIYEALSPGGIFVTFQYSLQMKEDLEEKFGQVQIKFTAFNVPPAFVYVCIKK